MANTTTAPTAKSHCRSATGSPSESTSEPQRGAESNASRHPRRTTDPVLLDLYARFDVPVNMYAVLNKRRTRVSFYGSFRSFRGTNGQRPVLVKGVELNAPEQIRAALADAQGLYAERVDKLEAARTNQPTTGLPYNPRLGPLAVYHMVEKAKKPSVADGTLGRLAPILQNWVRYFENDYLSGVTVARLQAYLTTRRQEPGIVPGRTVSENTVRNELYALSQLYKTADALELTSKRNPVSLLPNRPTKWVSEATWLTAREAAALLDAAVEDDRLTRSAVSMWAAHVKARHKGAPTCQLPAWVRNRARMTPCAEAILTFYLYTGARLTEGLGVRVQDVDFVRSIISFAEYEGHAFKRKWHRRAVELWPPLAAVLRRYLAETGLTTGPLFPGKDGRRRKRLRGVLDRCLRAAGLAGLPEERRIVLHSLRHTYATLMLQTRLPDGQGGWVRASTDDVRRRLGHRSTLLVETCYGHTMVGAEFTNGLTVEHHRRHPAERRPDGMVMSRERAHLALVA